MEIDEKVFSKLPERHIRGGEVIIEEGKPVACMYFLVSGTVSVTKAGIGIHRVTVPGAVFGEMSYLLGKPPMATVVADTACVMKVVEDSDQFILDNPETALYIAKILAARLDSVVGYLVDIKSQFPDSKNHFGMIDEILSSILNKHPRKIDKGVRSRDLVDD